MCRRDGRSTSNTSTDSANDTQRAATDPSEAITNDPPSKTSSSWPPTRFTQTTATPASDTRRPITCSRAACLPARNGDPLTFTTSCAPARARSLTGPSGTQASSHTVTPTTAPPISKSGGSSMPGRKWRSSSNTS